MDGGCAPTPLRIELHKCCIELTGSAMSGTAEGLSWVTGCRDDASRATDGLPLAADAPLQRSELAKSAISGLMHCSTARYSITSSARSRNESGRVNPIALAVRRLTTSSNLVGSWTGRSAGFSPFKILPT